MLSIPLDSGRVLDSADPDCPCPRSVLMPRPPGLAVCLADICDSTSPFEEHGDDPARPDQVVRTAETLAPCRPSSRAGREIWGPPRCAARMSRWKLWSCSGSRAAQPSPSWRTASPSRRRSRASSPHTTTAGASRSSRGPSAAGRGATSAFPTRAFPERTLRSSGSRSLSCSRTAAPAAPMSRSETKRSRFLHREQLRLHGSGRPSRGRHLGADDARPFRFACKRRSRA